MKEKKATRNLYKLKLIKYESSLRTGWWKTLSNRWRYIYTVYIKVSVINLWVLFAAINYISYLKSGGSIYEEIKKDHLLIKALMPQQQ